MIRRLYAHNYRCFQNFELKFGDDSSYLLIGKNGTGKSSIRKVLEILQAIGRGENRVRNLVAPRDFPGLVSGANLNGLHTRRMRFEVECDVDLHHFRYCLTVELPPGFSELRVAEESLHDGLLLVYSRELAQILLPKRIDEPEARFRVDWHLVALPVVQERSDQDPLFRFKKFLRDMIILSPIPSQIDGESRGDTLQPNLSGENFAAWFSGLLAFSPKSYSSVESYMRDVFPDFQDIQNPLSGTTARNMTVQFQAGGQTTSIPLKDLSDGEKCYLLSATVLASQNSYGPSLCFWDEPDNHLALDEIGHFIIGLRRLPVGSQFIATSHHPETIRRFSAENTLLLHRPTHLDPTQVRPVSDLNFGDDLVDALIRGDDPR